jgi:hypothetical protein
VLCRCAVVSVRNDRHCQLPRKQRDRGVSGGLHLSILNAPSYLLVVVREVDLLQHHVPYDSD